MASHLGFLKTPLAREIALIVLLKLVLLGAIHAVWFSTPSEIKDDTANISQHLLGSPSGLPEKHSNDL